MKSKIRRGQSNDLKFGLKIIVAVSIFSLILAGVVLYIKSDYKYINFNGYVNKDVKVIRERMVRDKYFYKYLLLGDKPSVSTDETNGYLLKETALVLYYLDSNKIKQIDSSVYKNLKSRSDLFKLDGVSFYLKDKQLVNKFEKLYNIEIESFDITNYNVLQEVAVSYNGNTYFNIKNKFIDEKFYTIGVKSLKKVEDSFVMNCYLYGYDSNISDSVLEKLKTQIKSGNFDYINEEFILLTPISVENKIITFRETPLDSDFKYQILEVENLEMNEY